MILRVQRRSKAMRSDGKGGDGRGRGAMHLERDRPPRCPSARDRHVLVEP
jgi:hypothetical protein